MIHDLAHNCGRINANATLLESHVIKSIDAGEKINEKNIHQRAETIRQQVKDINNTLDTYYRHIKELE